jgi:hypothetical protein
MEIAGFWTRVGILLWGQFFGGSDVLGPMQSGSINNNLDGSGSCSISIKEKLEMEDIYEAINESILFVLGNTNNDDDTKEATSNDYEMGSGHDGTGAFCSPGALQKESSEEEEELSIT